MTAPAHYKCYLPHALGGTLIVAVVVGMLWFVNHMLDSVPPTGKKTAQHITLLQPPAPPPLPPKVEEPPPEPEVVEEKTPEPEPQESETADEVPPGEELGLDMEGGAGGDAFGLVGKKGARDLIGGNSVSRLAWYNRILERDIQDQLAETACTRSRSYRAEWKLWLHPDGKVERIELSGSSGDSNMDECLRTASRSVRVVSERPPEEARNPVRIRITSRS